MIPATWTSNEHLDPAHLNSRIRDGNLALSKPPYAILSNAPTYNIAGNGATNELWFLNLASNKMTALTSGSIKRGVKLTEDGAYDIDLNISAQVDGGSPESHLIVFIVVNGSLAGRGIFTARHGYTQSAHVKRVLALNAGDEVTAHVFTDSGRTAKFGLTDSTNQGCRMTIHRIGARYPTIWP
ncbi:hypothetical protein ACFQ71_02990 [Streptomyces sp. NPDC056534]|uniref:hypothetical protein n=1 Tax=Streptomyces sp. NPDC056534 TaxID=3345857 RepID=UPI0036BAD731